MLERMKAQLLLLGVSNLNPHHSYPVTWRLVCCVSGRLLLFLVVSSMCDLPCSGRW